MNINPIILSIPVFFILIGIKLLVPLLLSVLAAWLGWQTWLYRRAMAYFIVSSTWFYSLQRQHAYLQMV